MKSAFAASLLFAASSIAVPILGVDKRDLSTKTHTETETVVVYTTVWEDDIPSATIVNNVAAAAAATPAAGLFYEDKNHRGSEKPAQANNIASNPPIASSSVAADPIVTPTPTPTPPPVTPNSTPAVKSEEAPAAPKPTTTPTPVAAAPSYAPEPKPVDTPSTGGGNMQTGSSFSINIVAPQGGPAACGQTIVNSGTWVAVDARMWDDAFSTGGIKGNGNSNPLCGKMIEATCDSTGKTVRVPVVDRCVDCKTANGLDFSTGAWNAMGLTEITRLTGTWKFVE